MRWRQTRTRNRLRKNLTPINFKRTHYPFLPLLALAVVAPFDPVPPSGGTRMPLLSVVGRVWQLGVSIMLAGIGFAALATFASLDFAERGWAGAGYAIFAYGACFVGVSILAGGLPDRLGGAWVAAISMAVEPVGRSCSGARRRPRWRSAARP